MDLRDKVEAICLELGISKSEFARRVGISPQYLSDILTRRSVPTGWSLAIGFERASGGALKLGDLVDDEVVAKEELA